VFVFSVLIVDLFLGGMGMVCCFLEEGEQTDARRARISHKFPKDCNRYRIRRNDKQRSFQSMLFGASRSDKNHPFGAMDATRAAMNAGAKTRNGNR
jgi:hypothetical protein